VRPLYLKTLRAIGPHIWDVKDRLVKSGIPEKELFFPFVLGKHGLQASSNFLVKFPLDLLSVVPSLIDEVSAALPPSRLGPRSEREAGSKEGPDRPGTRQGSLLPDVDQVPLFGPITGVDVGRTFANREELLEAGVHRSLSSMICGNEWHGAESIITDEIQDDDDYLSLDGRHPDSNEPVADGQLGEPTLRRDSQALRRSKLERLPVRVVRARPAQGSSVASFQYAGLFYVEDYGEIGEPPGAAGWRCRLRRLSHEELATLAKQNPPDEGSPSSPVERNMLMVSRLVRDPGVIMRVKAMYQNLCQVCGGTIATPDGSYSEAAHIKPLGKGHDGKDAIDNLLCLCPNDHVRLDKGAIYIDEDFIVRYSRNRQEKRKLITKARSDHPISRECIRYHRISVAKVD
jgi:putative restriction endonuclease